MDNKIIFEGTYIGTCDMTDVDVEIATQGKHFIELSTKLANTHEITTAFLTREQAKRLVEKLNAELNYESNI